MSSKNKIRAIGSSQNTNDRLSEKKSKTKMGKCEEFSATIINWSSQGLDESLCNSLRVIGEEYPLNENGRKGIKARFKKIDETGICRVVHNGNEVVVYYEKQNMALRAVGSLLSGIIKEGMQLEESSQLTTFGIMLDCSRNAVMTVNHFKRWLRQLSLLGYNMAMLYTENTYKLPGEDYFGYGRGGYTEEELREIELYASSLGIEMIGCIQTLGHLEQLLRWPEYGDIKDTNSVLLVGEEKTYELIEKMIALFARNYRSRRIHIGMDETFGLGCGRYINLYGYKRAFDLFSQHLQRVTEICRKYGLEPMLWSDMFFWMGSKAQVHYDKNSIIPDEVQKMIPQDAHLVYWDYSDQDASIFSEIINKHNSLGCEPIMATSVTTAQSLWYVPNSGTFPCISACRTEKVKELIVTLWGDDGAYCEFDSAFAGLVPAAEAAFGSLPPVRSSVQSKFSAICGADYEAVMIASEMFDKDRSYIKLLWDDPLLRIAWKNELLREPSIWLDMDIRFEKIIERLDSFSKVKEPIDLSHAVSILKFLRAKINLNIKLDVAYTNRDYSALKQVRSEIPAIITSTNQILASFRRQWYRRNKPFGFETIQYRIGGEKQRYQELSERLKELITGKISTIPEFDEHASTPSAYTHLAWRHLVVSGIM